MKKDYNREVMSDMQVDGSFTPSTRTTQPQKTTTKPKINVIGTQKRTTSTSSKSGAKQTTKQSPKNQTTSSSNSKIRTKLVGDKSQIEDLEKLNEENIKGYRFKAKRNKVVIVILSILLVIAIGTIIAYTVITRLKTNCNMFIHGDVQAVFIIDGEELQEFRTPANLQGNSILQLDIKVDIKTNAKYNVWFKPECYQKGVLMNNTLIYEHNTDLFYEGQDGAYYSKQPIQGGQIIYLCGGVILDRDYEATLNVDIFKMDFHVYFEKV